MEERPPIIATVALERKLTDNQQLAADVLYGLVPAPGIPGRVGKQKQF